MPALTIIHGLGGFYGNAAHFLTQVIIKEGRGRFFQQFLMTALNGTFTLAQMDDIAKRIGHDLEFDMARAFDQLFKINIPIAESGFGFASGGVQAGSAFPPGFSPPACLFRRRRQWL